MVCLSVCHSQDLGDSIILTLKTSINAKQIMFKKTDLPVLSLRKRTAPYCTLALYYCTASIQHAGARALYWLTAY